MNRVGTIILGFALISGCAMSEQTANTGNDNGLASAQLSACAATVYNSPEAAPIQSHTVINLDNVTPQQLNDKSKATGAEIGAIYGIHPAIQACRRAFLVSLESTTPTFVPIFADQYEKSARSLIELLQRRIGWGEYLRRAKANANEAHTRLASAAQKIDAGPDRSHAAELADRGAAAVAIAHWAHTEEMINAMGRSVMATRAGKGNVD